jgi:hypothetical protein
MREAVGRQLVDIDADPFISGRVSALFERAKERRSRDAPIANKNHRRVREEGRVRWLLGAEHEDMVRFRPDFVELRDDELERLVKYLERDANVWPDRGWTEWPPFPRLKEEEVRDLIASLPLHSKERDRQVEPLTDHERIDAEALAAKVRLGVYQADWSKLSRLVAGERFYNRFSYMFSGDDGRARPDYQAIILGSLQGPPDPSLGAPNTPGVDNTRTS